LAYYDFNVYLKDNNFNLEYTITKHKEMLLWFFIKNTIY
jgi:hypothetical protein